jgi:hypothetical protein
MGRKTSTGSFYSPTIYKAEKIAHFPSTVDFIFYL